MNKSTLRIVIREIIAEASFLDVLKTGAGKAFDYAQSTSFGKKLGFDNTNSDILKYLEDLSPDEIITNKQQGGAISDYEPQNDIMTAKLANDNMRALIIGDSQAGGPLGAEVEAELRQMGFVNVSRRHKTGASGAYVVGLVTETDVNNVDLVVAIFGGNDASVSSSTAAANELYDKVVGSGAKLIIIGPAPATKITNTDLAIRVWGHGANNPDYWLDDKASYAALRVEIAQALEDTMKNKAGAGAFGIAANMSPDLSGDDYYPPQPDGIHCYKDAARIARIALKGSGINKLVDEISGASSSDIQPSLASILGFGTTLDKEDDT